MKKLLFIGIFAALAMTSCTKKDGTADLPQPEQNSDEFSPVPEYFTRKILVEELTASWCGYCPRGPHYFHKIDSTFEGKVVGVSIHVSDAMEDISMVGSNGYNLLDSALFHNYDHTDAGYPNGSVNRMAPLTDPSGMYGQVLGLVGTYAKCGLAIDASTVSGNTLTVTVHAGFATSLNSDYRLNVWLVESPVSSTTNPSYDQRNYYSQSGSHPDSAYRYYGVTPSINYYNLPPSINGYKHENVLRKSMTSLPFGDQLAVGDMAKGNHYKKTFTISLSGYNSSNCYVVAFIDKYGTDFLNNEHQVQNVQKVKVGSKKSWD